jgi:uncharacterized membrane protein HdeD (DUF308 family)
MTYEGPIPLRQRWKSFLVLGILLVLLGTISVALPWIATLAQVLILGWVVLFCGISEIVASFWMRHWDGFFLHLLSGVLAIVIGGLILGHPIGAAAGLTMLIAALLLVNGMFRVIGSVMLRFPNWYWVTLDGLVSILLGAMIWHDMPGSALWVIGLFVGINMIFRGWAWIMLSMALKRMNAATTA